MWALIILLPFKLLYIPRRSCHFYHPRIVHLCDVKGGCPLEEAYFQVIDLNFLLFLWSGYIKFGIKVMDIRVSLLQTNHLGIFIIIFFFCKSSEVEILTMWNQNLGEHCINISELVSQYSSSYGSCNLGFS